ncbi:MAG: ABC transporter permease [Cytophaga sp.]|nr:ABC transporter permease [Cytophaga sp.]
MFKNYFKIAFRTLQRNLAYSLINVIGLSIGIASSILILLWVYDEISYDTHFTNYNLIHQVKLNTTTETEIITRAQVPMPLKDVLESQDSRVDKSCITIRQNALLTVGDKKMNKVGLDAGESFLEMFDFKMIEGNPATALKELRSIVLTQSTATALFGKEDPMGKMVQVKIENTEELKVTGVIADPPVNSTFRPDFILPFAYFEATSVWVHYARSNWNNNAFEIYVQLQPGANKEDVDLSIRDLIKKNSKDKSEKALFLHPMSHWKLYDKFENGKEVGRTLEYLRMFSCIAIFILVIACINFMNLSTARSEHRAREVGIRKSVGSNRKQLLVQFLGESILIAGMAFILSIVLVELLLPFYTTWVRKELTINYASPAFWLFGISLTLITGLLAGSYPAFYLSSFKPIAVLKGKMAAGKRGNMPRQVTVTLQFGFSILLIIGTIVVYQQINYLRHREIGYDRENLMMVWSSSDIEKNFKPLKEELLRSGAAVSVCKSSTPITAINSSSPLQGWPGMLPDQKVEVNNIATEYDYTKTMGVRLIEGRDFSEEFKSDTAAILLNQAAVNTLHLKDPIGSKIEMWGQSWNVIGVMEDVIMFSVAHHVEPLVMTMDPTWSNAINIRLPKTGDVNASIKRVEGIFKKYNPDYPFDYDFADTEFEFKFWRLNMIGSMAGAFTLLAIFITALGLLGMAAFTAEQRTKEIGIRQVMGASLSSIVVLLTKDFSRLVIIAFMISAPLAWWAVDAFLKSYEIRIPVPLWVFPVAGGTALLLTIIIVSTQALRAATNNLVKSLRSE